MPTKDRNLGLANLNRLKWRAVWLPSLSIAILIIGEHILEYRRPHADWLHLLTFHLPLIAVVALGAYLFSTFTFRIIRRSQEEILRRNAEAISLEKRFGALIENSTDLIILLSAEGVVRYISPSVTRMLGYTPQELIGRSLLNEIVPHDHVRVKNVLYEAARKAESVLSDSFRIYHKDGNWHWINVLLRNLLDDPNIGAIVWNARDITDWKLASDSLRSLTDGVPVGIYRSAVSGEILTANPAFVKILGFPNEGDLLTTNAMDFYADAGDRLRWQELMARNGMVRDFEYRARRRDGTIIWVKDSARRVQDEHKGITYYEGAIDDVTDRKQAERALLDRQAQLAGILQSAMDAIIAVNASERIMLFNTAAERMFRCSATQAMDQPIERFISNWSRIHEKERDPALNWRGAAGQTGWSLDDLTGFRATGDKFPIEALIWKSKTGTQTIYTLSVRDITEHRQAMETLRKLSRAIDQVAESIFIINHDYIIEYVNPAFETMTGFARTDAVGKPVSILRSGLHDDAFYEDIRKKRMSGHVFKEVFTNRKKDGRIYLMEEIVTPIVDAQGTITHFVSTGRDVTDRVRTDKELRRSRRQLRALAARVNSVREEEQTRIAQVMHDELGQALTALKYDLAWLGSRIPGHSTSLQQKCDEMGSLVDATIASMRQIASELHPRLLDDLGLEPAVEWLVKNFQHHTGLRCELDSHLGEVALTPGLSTAVFRILQEALTNVARHAKATGVAIKLHWDKDDLVLVVRDDGRGISEQEVTGMKSLGILGMQERALAWGGTVSISGEAGQGTTLVARFPREHAGAAATLHPPAPDERRGEEAA
jgi:PAS domain S-box-containing protein